jgi:hypothetical protein
MFVLDASLQYLFWIVPVCRSESVKEEVSEVIERHIRELRTRERLLHDDIDTFLGTELRSLRTHQENLEVRMLMMMMLIMMMTMTHE